jgi:RHS repeat-associated protein
MTRHEGAVQQPFTYTGREYDSETGLYYYRARYYDTKVGRFISKDPIGFLGGDFNLSRYVWNSPTNLIDPLGLMGIAVDFGGSYATGWGGDVNPDAAIAQGGSAGTGFYLGVRNNGGAEIGGFTYQATMTNSGVTPGAAIGAGANFTIYFANAENFFPGKLKYTSYVIGPFSMTFSQDPCTGKLRGVTGSLLGKGLGWLINSQGYSYGLQGILK